MKATISDLRSALFATKDGGAACDAINELSKRCKTGNAEAKSVLAEYACNVPVEHMRSFACSALAKSVDQSDVEFAEVFERGLSDVKSRYWSILGFINTLGRGAFEALVKIAADASVPIEDRGHAIKCLATYSKQRFDRQLPSDPGHWKESDLRLSEIANWAKVGFPDGGGYSGPERHPALDKPTSEFEKIVYRIEKKLLKKRRNHQDAADPTEWLALADPNDIQRITARWKLPSIYLDFLTRFSPIKVTFESRRFYNHFQLFGAGELIDAQDGYSFNSLEQQSIESWPPEYVVIASHGGDPFVLDLSNSDGSDAPIFTAEHGMGDWDFSEEACSFTAFLESLAK